MSGVVTTISQHKQTPFRMSKVACKVWRDNRYLTQLSILKILQVEFFL